MPTPSPSAINPSQHQGLFQSVGFSYQVDKVLTLQLQHQSFQWMLKVDFFQDWLVWPPCNPRDSQEFSPAPQFESINSSALSLLYGPAFTSEHYYWMVALTIGTFSDRMMVLLFNMLSRFVIAFLPRSNCLFILWLQSPLAVILESKKIKSVITSTFPLLFAIKWWGWMSWSHNFFHVDFQASFFTLLFHSHHEIL